MTIVLPQMDSLTSSTSQNKENRSQFSNINNNMMEAACRTLDHFLQLDSSFPQLMDVLKASQGKENDAFYYE